MFKVKSQTASSYCISTVSLQAVVNHVWTHSKTDFWEENRQETETETERKSPRETALRVGGAVIPLYHSKRMTFNHLEPTGVEFQ